jgi:hypothetical protein
MKHVLLTAVLLLTQLGTAAFAADSSLGYDPAADPFAQLREARAEAERDGKNVLVVAGGDWCIWCHYLNAFLETHPEVSGPLERAFVVVKAHLGEENMNAAFFAVLPEAAGYPHFWVVGSDGTVLQSQDTLPLEDGGKSYDVQRFLAFIEQWQRKP